MSAERRLGALLSQLRHGGDATAAAPAAASPYVLPSAQKQLEKYGPVEWELRCKLAVAYRIARHEGWDQWLFNHITVKVPGSEKAPDGPHFLINPFGLRFDEVTASSLLKVTLDGKVVDPGTGVGSLLTQGFIVHSAVHLAREDLHAVWHCHHPDTTALSITKFPLIPLTQESLIFYPNKISYHPFEGSATDTEERPRMAKNLGPVNTVLMLENHGPITAGGTIEEAFTQMAVLTRACTYQVRALAAVGGDISKIRTLPEKQLEEMASRMSQDAGPEAKAKNLGLSVLMFRSVARLMEARYGAENIYQ
eukprot:Hpha_TRINITY_DN16915_c1_g2::TRINITY_DN16915_c1_g2_i2::g.53847::m.53847/K18622/ADD; adducin